MIIAMVVIPILLGLILSSLIFDVVQKKFGPKAASTMRAVYYFPQLLPIAIGSLVMGWIFRAENGALNSLLSAIGLGSLQHDWLGKPDTALIFLMLIMIWIQVGYPLVIFMSGLQRVDPELLRPPASMAPTGGSVSRPSPCRPSSRRSSWWPSPAPSRH